MKKKFLPPSFREYIKGKEKRRTLSPLLLCDKVIVALEVELGILRYTEPPEGKAAAGSTSRIVS